MSPAGRSILDHLHDVAAERSIRNADAALVANVAGVKAYQQRRFEQTYADLLASDRHAAAARFFLDDLYGPGDFSQRDAQFVRIVPALVRLFPNEIVDTVRALAELHAVSEKLDTAMAQALPRAGSGASDTAQTKAAGYAVAWQIVGQPQQRERQIALMLDIGRALDGYVRNPLLRTSLKLMRGPARAAGLGMLQDFLEKGFDTFKRMGGAAEFLETVATRERAFAAALFAGDNATLAAIAGGKR